MIKDLEQEELDKANTKKRKRDNLEDDSDTDDEDLQAMRKKIRDSRSRAKSPAGENRFKQASPQAPLRKRDAKAQGHQIK